MRGMLMLVAALMAIVAGAGTAHEELMKFVGSEGLLHDYIGEIPTPTDCAECRPNAMGWWSPIENGPMFTGPWLEACVIRAKKSGKEEDRALCWKLIGGLILAASVSDVPGMIVRGVATDGKAHHPLGSEDQTLPWFYGMSAYVQGGFDADGKVAAKMKAVAEALEKVDWQCPCDQSFAGEFRGKFKKGLPFRSAAHYLFILRATYEATHDRAWLGKYEAARDEEQPGAGLTRLEVCATGYAIDIPKLRNLEPGLLWIYTCGQGCLARLAEWDKEHASSYRKGLVTNAERARKFIAAYRAYDNSTERPFKYANWRTGYKWRIQKTQKDAEAVAYSGDRAVLGDRKGFERRTMTAPLSAAAICAYAGLYKGECAAAIAHYDYSTLCVSEFFQADVIDSLL